MTLPKITILPAPGCRRSRRILEYLDQHSIPFNRIPLDSPEGVAIAEKYNMRASPGILVNGVSINPHELLIQINLTKLGDTETFLKLSWRVLQLLYARLQEFGLCPPNVQALLRMKCLQV